MVHPRIPRKRACLRAPIGAGTALSGCVLAPPLKVVEARRPPLGAPGDQWFAKCLPSVKEEHNG